MMLLEQHIQLHKNNKLPFCIQFYMQRSELDEHYSLSNKLTCKEMISSYDDYEQIYQTKELEYVKYIDPFTNKVKSEIIINRDKCPLCDSKNYRYLFAKHGFDHMVCDSCDLIFTLQILDNSKISHIEEGKAGDSYGDYKLDSTINKFDQIKFEIIFKQLEKFGEIKNILDVGSQIGTFLDWASKKYSIIGHEYHAPIREQAIKKGHTVLNNNLEEITFNQEFDLITCWDYIDHILNPREVIKNLSKYIKKGGLFFFAINNRDSLAVRMMHADSTIFIGAHHTMHYGIKQLEKLMEGYELLHSESYVSELNWISNWLNFKNPELGDTKLMFDLFDPKKISELGMGFKVNAIFRKT